MVKLKSARHHWWPECVSRNWADADGKTGWLSWDGSEKRLPPAQLGAIGNGHHIKLGSSPDIVTGWDTSFESEFDNADSWFPQVIAWLDGLERIEVFDDNLRNRFYPQDASERTLTMLTECVVSLAVRSPMNREASVRLAEHLRGPLPSRERNTLIGMNMQRSQRMISDQIRSNGKFAVVYSPDNEFIYGDGFFNNVCGLSNPPLNPTLIAPITPSISVIICRPSQYRSEPKLFTIVLAADEVNHFNHAIQVYSRQSLFFRRDKPTLGEDFRAGEHRRYQNSCNPMDTVTNAIPGVVRR